MIHDATVEVTCDAKGCTKSEHIGLTWRLGGYDDSDDEVERKLTEYDWTVRNGHHYCYTHRDRQGE